MLIALFYFMQLWNKDKSQLLPLVLKSTNKAMYEHQFTAKSVLCHRV